MNQPLYNIMNLHRSSEEGVRVPLEDNQPLEVVGWCSSRRGVEHNQQGEVQPPSPEEYQPEDEEQPQVEGVQWYLEGLVEGEQSHLEGRVEGEQSHLEGPVEGAKLKVEVVRHKVGVVRRKAEVVRPSEGRPREEEGEL